MDPLRLFAVDPGGTTGFAYYDEEADFFQSYQQEGYDDAAEIIWNMAVLNQPSAMICEAFVIRQNTHKLDAGAFNQTTDLIGACRLTAFRNEIPFVRQTPAEAKSIATDAKIKALRWYRATPGGHANDAARHLLCYLIKHNHVPTLRRLTGQNP